MKRIIVFLVLACVAATLLTGCFKSDEQLIEDRINGFARALNAGDIEKALDCLDSSTRTAGRAMLNITNSLLGIGVSVSDLLALGIAFGEIDGGFVISGITSVDVDGDRATATVVMGETEYSVGLVKEDGDWFITPD